MPKVKKNEPFDPRNMKPEEVLKFEIATELGLGDKVIQSDGAAERKGKRPDRRLITKRKREMKNEALSKGEEA